MKIINFKLTGLHCEACAKLSSLKLKKISGVLDVKVDPSGQTEVTTDRDINMDEFRTALIGTDYSII